MTCDSGAGPKGPDTVRTVTTNAGQRREEAVGEIAEIVRDFVTDDVVRALRNDHGVAEIRRGIKLTLGNAAAWHGKV